MIKKIFIKIIKFYQKNISPLKPPVCKYYPTCSNYALEAFQEFNWFKALILSIWRVLRCNPFSKGGYDPIPKKNNKK
ncbi:membrane protein insertion efficiency factor YidD [bacterium]|nr:membrane protein insertion efficiency factor YidD [bacterium]